nr:hypothetical protein [Granulicella sp. dw_53]
MLPKGWTYIVGFGICQSTSDSSRSNANVCLREDVLEGEDTLISYIEKQAKLVKYYLGSPAMAGPQPISFDRADEAFLFLVRHISDKIGPMVHAQTYVRFNRWVGVATLTTPEAALSAVRPDYDAFLRDLEVVL